MISASRARAGRRSPSRPVLGTVVLSASLLLPCAASNASAQTVVVGSGITCSSCRIDLERVAVIGGRASAHELSGPPWLVTRLRSGSYLIKGENDGGDLHLFDRAGRWVRQVARTGAGPGEFNDIMAVERVAGDSLWVFDPGNGRITVLAADLTVARSVPLGVRMENAVVLGDSAVVTAQLRTPEAVGYPLHVVSSANHAVRSFGSENPTFRADDFGLNRRTLARGPRSTVWAAHYQAYIIEQWDVSGELKLRIVRDAEWFRPQVRPPSAQPGRPPLPKIVGIRFDSATSHLWIATVVPAPGYRAAFGTEPQQIEGQLTYPVVDWHALYETVIEVIDVRRSSVVSRQQFPQPFLRWTGDDEFATYTEDRRGNPIVTIWRATLRTRERR
jgi:hypothetical protein